MEVENMGSTITSNNKADEDHFPLPGFRFHPTDEELVGFYLRRKIEKRPISVELIKQADIYKYDPWNLPKSSINAGDKEWYFFCKRGRKYKNSIRPNRVTASGFWKATGIDRSIYSSGGGGGECIGLKKSLVYYRGSAGKGTKTDWMMHEFRLPPKNTNHNIDAKLNTPQEAEVWTLCRIFKRTSASYRKCTPNLREVTAKKSNNIANPVLIYNNNASSQTCSMDSSGSNNRQSSYISFSNVPIITQNVKKPYSYNKIVSTANQQFFGNFNSTIVSHEAPSVDSSFTSSINSSDMNELLRHADWEDLRSMMDYAGVGPFYT